MIRPILALTAAASLVACNNLTDAQRQQVAAGINAGVTLADIAAANNATVTHLVQQGALFCSKAGTSLPAIFVLANAAGAPVAVTGQASSAVQTACATLQAIPVAPPDDPASTPVVAAPDVTLPGVQSVPTPLVAPAPLTGART